MNAAEDRANAVADELWPQRLELIEFAFGHLKTSIFDRAGARGRPATRGKVG